MLVDSPNVHPRYICIKCRVKCSNKDYLTGKNKPSQEAKLWFPHGNDCVVCLRQEARGRPVKRKKLEVPNKEGEPEVDTDSASDDMDEPEFVPRSVYILAMDGIVLQMHNWRSHCQQAATPEAEVGKEPENWWRSSPAL